jgi:hypothetical protein|tara:strand:+ start:465 stop:689 length:225 start_codon:yes stop_codon:yes gene_type:complete
MRRTFSQYCQQWEDAAANSVSGGGVSMPADAMPKDKHKKHKKANSYDGRTKEGRRFVERIMAKRAARESAKNKV